MSYRDHPQYESFFLEYCRDELAGRNPAYEYRFVRAAAWQPAHPSSPPQMHPGVVYRSARKKIKIGERNVNAPLGSAPKKGTHYWYVSGDGTCCRNCWSDLAFDERIFGLGNCWETEEDAQAYADAARDQRLGTL